MSWALVNQPNHLKPVRRPIRTVVNVDCELVILLDVGTRRAEYVAEPDVFGLKMQVAVWTPETSVVSLLEQPGIFRLPT